MDFDNLMSGLFERYGVVAVEPDENGAYIFLCDTTSVCIMPLYEARKVVFYSPLCAEPEKGAERLAKVLLQCNFLYQAGSGAVFAQDPKNGFMVLQRYESLVDLDVSTLANHLDSFLEIVEHWRDLITQYDPDEIPQEEPTEEPREVIPSNWLAI